MRKYALLALVLCTFSAQGATSDIYFPTGGGIVTNPPGNVGFDGQHFVSPTVSTNGRIFLAYFDTNAVAVSNESSGANGISPRILCYEPGKSVLAWLDTNAVENVLMAQGRSGGFGGINSSVATNVAEESIGLSRLGDQILVVWQSSGSNSAVLGRLLNLSGAPIGPIFGISSNAQPQRYPSVDNDGVGHLVCWMQQNSETNDWSVAARRVVDGAPSGNTISVSETNSMRPYQTACSFGTNYLVLWSADEGPWLIDTNLYGFDGVSNLWRPTVHGRMVSGLGLPRGHEFSMLRANHSTTNVAAAYGDGQYVVTCNNDGAGRQVGQVLNADGGRRGASFRAWEVFASLVRPHVTFGAGRFCVAYATGGASAVRIIKRETISDISITGAYRTNGSIGLTGTTVPGVSLQASTNLSSWENIWPWQLSSMGSRPQLYLRLSYHAWNCIENLRLMDDAKQNWAFSSFRSFTATPTANDLFDFGSMPTCPNGGSYTIDNVATKPHCTISGHTL